MEMSEVFQQQTDGQYLVRKLLVGQNNEQMNSTVFEDI